MPPCGRYRDLPPLAPLGVPAQRQRLQPVKVTGMGLVERFAERAKQLDNRFITKSGRRPTVRSDRLGGCVLVALAAVLYLASFFDAQWARAAVVPAFIAGLALGRVQEYREARRGRGLGED